MSSGPVMGDEGHAVVADDFVVVVAAVDDDDFDG